MPSWLSPQWNTSVKCKTLKAWKALPITYLCCCCCCCCWVTSVVSNSVQPHRRQPTRLPHPWDSPGKNTGVGCHFLLQSMKVKSESKVVQSCPTLSDAMDCSLPGSSVQARVLEWHAIAFSDISLQLMLNSHTSVRFLLTCCLLNDAILFKF